MDGFRDGNRQNRFKDETCTYCNKKGNTETVCFAKRDDDKLTKMAQKVSAVKAKQITTTNIRPNDRNESYKPSETYILIQDITIQTEPEFF